MKIVLSIDGGGIRGIIPAAILAYLEEKIQKVTEDNRIRLANYIDFVAGTSTGSIIGAMMLLPDKNKKFKYPQYSLDEIKQMYIELGERVFEKKIKHNIKTLWGIFGPRFPDSNIEQPLLKYMDHIKMKDLIKPCMFSGYDIDKRQVNFYTNSDESEKYCNCYIKDIVRGSTAIPSYFSPAYFKECTNINTIIDGGVFANNPSLAAFIEISKTLFREEDFKKRKFNTNDILIISLGTGDFKQKSYKYSNTKRWGKAQWLMPVIDVLLTSHAEVTNYEMEKIFSSNNSNHNYKRINPPIILGSSNALDASKENLILLLKDVNNYIEENKELLNTLAREICDINFLRVISL